MLWHAVVAMSVFRKFPLGTRLFALVALPLLITSVWLWAAMQATLPVEGRLRLTRGVSAPVTIDRDSAGAVHIRAEDDNDAFFAVGFAHAQDRLWQLELQQRMVRGSLSELFGKESVESDLWFRTLGLYESTASAWAALSPQARRSLTAYSAGINAWLAEKHRLPAEFQVFGIRPSGWSERDSLAWVKMFALNLGGNYRREIARYVASKSLNQAQLSAFFPNYPLDAPSTVAAIGDHDVSQLVALSDFQQSLEQQFGLALPNTGSNAWVVSGRHTQDGSALLANDPHLGLQIPSLWYVLSVDAPTLKTSGMSLVGLPLVVFGRNAHIAWGGTNMMADAQDLFFERSDPSGANYAVEDQWQPFASRTESIRVRADFPGPLRKQNAPLSLTIRTSRHGPVISDRFGVFDQPVSLRWTALDAGDTSYEAFFRMNYATDWTSFKDAMSVHVAPAMNLVYADREGNIGYLGVGRIPVRRQGNGTLPSPGWDDNYGWSGEIPPAQWPQSFNPPKGYIVSANNKVGNDAYPYFISNDWASPARAIRIEQLLRARIDSGQQLNVLDMQRIQGDTVDLEAAAMMAQLRKRLPAGEHGARAAAYLKDWNGDMRAESQAAAIFHVWMRHFRQSGMGGRNGNYWDDQQEKKILDSLQRNVALDYLATQLDAGGSAWCDDPATTAYENCNAALATAQEAALWELHTLKGDWSMESWHWGEVQTTVYAHTPFSQWKPLGNLFGRRIGSGGSPNTVNAADSVFAGSDGYLQAFGAGFRQVISLHPTQSAHYYMVSTGQSGNIASEHYDDMVVPFRDLQYRRIDIDAVPAIAPGSAR